MKTVSDRIIEYSLSIRNKPVIKIINPRKTRSLVCVILLQVVWEIHEVPSLIPSSEAGKMFLTLEEKIIYNHVKA